MCCAEGRRPGALCSVAHRTRADSHSGPLVWLLSTVLPLNSFRPSCTWAQTWQNHAAMRAWAEACGEGSALSPFRVSSHARVDGSPAHVSSHCPVAHVSSPCTGPTPIPAPCPFSACRHALTVFPVHIMRFLRLQVPKPSNAHSTSESQPQPSKSPKPST